MVLDWDLGNDEASDFLNYYVWEFQHIAQDSQIVLYALY